MSQKNSSRHGILAGRFAHTHSLCIRHLGQKKSAVSGTSMSAV